MEVDTHTIDHWRALLKVIQENLGSLQAESPSRTMQLALRQVRDNTDDILGKMTKVFDNGNSEDDED